MNNLLNHLDGFIELNDPIIVDAVESEDNKERTLVAYKLVPLDETITGDDYDGPQATFLGFTREELDRANLITTPEEYMRQYKFEHEIMFDCF